MADTVTDTRWTLTVEFDTIEEHNASASDPTALGEAAEFYAYLLECWGEESEQDVKWDGDTLVITVDVLDYLHDPWRRLLDQTIPKRLELVRNEER